MEPNQKRRRFYLITALVFVAIIAVAVFIVVDIEYSYVKIGVVGNSEVSFVVSYDSATASLSAAENATVEVLPQANVTITASVNTPYFITHWEVAGAVAHQEGPDAVWFLTGAGGSMITVSVALGSNASARPAVP